MKHIILLIAILIGSMAMPAKSAARDKNELATVVFSVSMHCNNCKKKIENSISFEKGVKDLQVNLEDKTVSVTYRKDKTNSEKLMNVIKELGYTVLIKEEKKVEKQ